MGLRGVFPQNIFTSGSTLSKAHYIYMNTCSTLPDCAVLTELRDRDNIEAIADHDYAGLPSTSEETKVVVAPLMPPEV